MDTWIIFQTEHSTTPSRPARAAPGGQGQAGASRAHGGHERDGSVRY